MYRYKILVSLSTVNCFLSFLFFFCLWILEQSSEVLKYSSSTLFRRVFTTKLIRVRERSAIVCSLYIGWNFWYKSQVYTDLHLSVNKHNLIYEFWILTKVVTGSSLVRESSVEPVLKGRSSVATLCFILVQPCQGKEGHEFCGGYFMVYCQGFN